MMRSIPPSVRRPTKNKYPYSGRVVIAERMKYGAARGMRPREGYVRLYWRPIPSAIRHTRSNHDGSRKAEPPSKPLRRSTQTAEPGRDIDGSGTPMVPSGFGAGCVRCPKGSRHRSRKDEIDIDGLTFDCDCPECGHESKRTARSSANTASIAARAARDRADRRPPRDPRRSPSARRSSSWRTKSAACRRPVEFASHLAPTVLASAVNYIHSYPIRCHG
jgi:hypothetical protein